MSAMIEVSGVVYDYPAARALHGVSFEVQAGAVLALVGPNGAGKSTLMRCIAALDVPTEGTIKVAGLDVEADPRGVHAAIGYLPDFFGLYEELSVRKALTYAARSRGVAVGETPAAVEMAAARVQLTDRLEARAGELSRGLKQRLAIAQTIVHQPRVLLLDEPAAGLDPEARRSLSDLILSLARDGMTIVVSSHILAELEDYSTQMLMIRDGAVAGGGVVAAGAGHRDGQRVEVTFADPPLDLAERIAALGVAVEQTTADTALLLLPEGEDDSGLLGKLIGAGLKVRSFQAARKTLEDAYLAEVAR
ncbi:MAG: ABC transporter ATP-binding protein [Phenylobacterium sp.]|uniref:ABC transporter ATP-binding protein n=1 Tax=Phenylobacterium sp. TaxID=1871053 RepID=UPI001B73BB6D|nr:ABC transporter ATP-binding protein [Phenylobacterium sp.]MBP7650674.1 ABC transporter ATP-binding protein [Phenylobacterium sp.]MBP7816340.1 ABC transporter ATP-binding protein [Phenylobacterium sp.]MBP9755908.1 ABC transporter ATP-binding protein [Phenylobacterium sp.]